MSFKIFVFCSILMLVHSLPVNKQCHDLKSCFNKNKTPDPKQLCEACYVVMPLARDLIKKHNETKLIKEIATFICTYLNIEELEICADAIDLFTVIEMLKNLIFLSKVNLGTSFKYN